MERMCVLRAEIPKSPLLKAELGLSAEIPLSSQSAFHFFYKTASHFNKIDFEDKYLFPGIQPQAAKTLFHIKTATTAFQLSSYFLPNANKKLQKCVIWYLWGCCHPWRYSEPKGMIQLSAPADPAQSRIRSRHLDLVIPGLFQPSPVWGEQSDKIFKFYWITLKPRNTLHIKCLNLHKPKTSK